MYPKTMITKCDQNSAAIEMAPTHIQFYTGAWEPVKRSSNLITPLGPVLLAPTTHKPEQSKGAPLKL
jgi:hypothetical protein